MTCVSAGHINNYTDTNPGSEEREVGWKLNPPPTKEKSRALQTELHRNK